MAKEQGKKPYLAKYQDIPDHVRLAVGKACLNTLDPDALDYILPGKPVDREPDYELAARAMATIKKDFLERRLDRIRQDLTESEDHDTDKPKQSQYASEGEEAQAYDEKSLEDIQRSTMPDVIAEESRWDNPSTKHVHVTAWRIR